MRGFFMFKLLPEHKPFPLRPYFSPYTPFQMLCNTMWGLNEAICIDNLVETIVSSIFLLLLFWKLLF